MIDRVLLAMLFAACLTSPAFAQGPPPPVPVPEQFQAPVDGYDMAVPYQRWRLWIEAQKGAVTERALIEPDTVEGRGGVGGPLFRVAFNNDIGRLATGEVRVFCTVTPVYPDRDRGECSYLYRRADVPAGPGYGGASNPFDLWMRENFDPALVARNLRAAGAAPGDDLWPLRNEMFVGAASPEAMLTENRRIVRVDSRDCPAFRRAVEAVEQRRLDWTLDLYAVGEDQPRVAPRPHAGTVDYTLNVMIDGQSLTLSGGPALAPLLGPVLDAVYACEQARTPRP